MRHSHPYPFAARSPRRRRCTGRLSALGLSTIFLAIAAHAQGAPPYNFIVILTDDQRWDTLWAMPEVTRLAAQGVTFDNAFSTFPVCAPTRASILSGGFHPYETGVVGNDSPNGGARFLRDLGTIATALRDAGYQTAHIGKYLNEYPQHMEPYIPPGWSLFVHDKTVGSSGAEPSVGVWTAPLNSFQLYSYREHALRFIEANANSPYLLIISTTQPHRNAFTLPVEDRTLFPDFLYRSRGYGESDLSDKPKVIRTTATAYPWWYVDSVEQEDEFHRDQLRSLMAVDRVLGALMNKVEQLGQSDRTVFVFLSDQGLLWGEHGQFGKGLAYEESIRVPFVVSVPGIATRRDPSLVVANLDLPATLLDLAGIAADTQGRSLYPLLQDPDTAWRVDFPFEFWDNQFVWAALRTREARHEWKYVEWQTGEQELYDLTNDPYELESKHADPSYASVMAALAARRAQYPRGLAVRHIGKPIPYANAGQPYEFQIAVWGGEPPYHFSHFGRLPLPPGLSLDPNTGELRGIPRVSGSYAFSILITDSSTRRHAGGSQRVVRDFALTVRDGADQEGDGYPYGLDNCPVLYNPDQADADADGVGDACDACPACVCGDARRDPGEECDDGNTLSGDGCSETCRTENLWPLSGTAVGGTIRFSIEGIPVVVVTLAGQSAAEVAASIAAAINADPALVAAGIIAVSSDNSVAALGTISDVVVTDPGIEQGVEVVPGLDRGAVAILAALLAASAYGYARARRRERWT